MNGGKSRLTDREAHGTRILLTRVWNAVPRTAVDAETLRIIFRVAFEMICDCIRE